MDQYIAVQHFRKNQKKNRMLAINDAIPNLMVSFRFDVGG